MKSLYVSFLEFLNWVFDWSVGCDFSLVVIKKGCECEIFFWVCLGKYIIFGYCVIVFLMKIFYFIGKFIKYKMLKGRLILYFKIGCFWGGKIIEFLRLNKIFYFKEKFFKFRIFFFYLWVSNKELLWEKFELIESSWE